MSTRPVVGGQTRNGTKIRGVVEAQLRNITKGYNVTGGALRPFYTSGQPMSNLPIGALIKYRVGGVDRHQILIQLGKPPANTDDYGTTTYDDSFNNTVTLLAKNVFELQVWHSANVNDYANSTIHAHLNSVYFNSIEERIRNIMREVKIPYRYGSGSGSLTDPIRSGANGLPAKVWLLGTREVGWIGGLANPRDGTQLSYFPGSPSAPNETRIAYLDTGVASDWWVRTLAGAPGGVWCVQPTGALVMAANPIQNRGIRPATALPADTLVSTEPDIDGAYTIL